MRVLALDMGEGRPPWSFRDSVDQGVAVRRLAWRWQGCSALADLVAYPRAEEALRAWLAEGPCDLVHAQHLTGFGLGALGAIRRAGLPLVMTLHDYWPLCPRGQMLRSDGSRCEEVVHVACAECLATTWPHLMPSGGGEARGPSGQELPGDLAVVRARSEFALESLRAPDRHQIPSRAALEVFAGAGLERERMGVVENGIEVAEIARAVTAERALRPRRDDELRVGVLGAVQPSKGVLELCLALRGVEDPRVRIEVHGELAPYHGDASTVEALRELAAGDGRIRLLGPYPAAELPRVLARLDAVAAPSRWNEVFGLSVREARAAGLPVLVSEVGGLARAAAPEGTLSPDDPGAWARALSRLVDPAFRSRLAAAPEPRGAGEMAREVAGVYRVVLSGPAGSGRDGIPRPG